MARIDIKDKDGKTVRYARLDDGNLIVEFEYYARFEGEGDYEVIQTVEPKNFEKLAKLFGIDPKLEILAVMRQISDSGRGQELVEILTSNKIENKLWTWLS